MAMANTSSGLAPDADTNMQEILNEPTPSKQTRERSHPKIHVQFQELNFISRYTKNSQSAQET